MTSKLKNEKGVKREVKKLLNAHKWFWWMPAANGYGSAGIADFCAIRNGVFMAIETKFGKNKPTALQLGFLSSVTAEDGFAFIINEDNLEWLARWLGAFDSAITKTLDGGKESHEEGALMINALRELTAEIV